LKNSFYFFRKNVKNYTFHFFEKRATIEKHNERKKEKVTL